MSGSLLTARELFGLFELDAAGTVLYYRVEPCEEPCGEAPDMEGRNFYEAAPFENVEDFRRCVTQFALGASPADSFKFDFRYKDYAQPVKVLLARIRERLDRNVTKSVLMHIRRAA